MPQPPPSVGDARTSADEGEPSASAAGERTSLATLALLFFRLGATSFGGPAAHIAMIEDEVVRRRRWLSEERFLDLLGAANLIPGPTSTELAIHIGFERRRWPGLVVAGLAFIVPAMLVTAALGWAYVRYGSVPEVAWLLYGIKPAILAVVVQAIWGLAPKAARTAWLRVLAALAVVAFVIGVNEIAVLLGAGAACALALAASRARAKPPAPPTSSSTSSIQGIAPIWPLAAASAAAGAGASVVVTLPALFFVFLKIGALLFGSGYVLLAFLRADLVERLGWLTEAQLMDAVAVGQVTPGPVFTTATFIGYLLAGPSGALVATAGIFLPAFVFVALSGPLLPRVRASPVAGAFLDGAAVASLALMAVVTVQLGLASIVDAPTICIALVGAVVLVRFKKVNATWIVIGGALAGVAVRALSS